MPQPRHHAGSDPVPGLGAQPISVALFVGDRFPMLSLAICTESLRLANRELGWPGFAPAIVSERGGAVHSSGRVQITADAAISGISFAPVIIVLTSYEPEQVATPDLLAWLRRQDRLGALIGCADTGGYVLARAGILRDRAVAVHHEMLPAYREELSGKILLDRLYADADGLVSSGGGMATLDMMLGLIARCHDEALADRVADILNYRRQPEIADATIPRTDGAIARSDPRLGRMVELMQSHLDAPLPIDAICRMAHVDPSTARRLFHREFATTPQGYYTQLRLHHARNLLHSSVLPISDVARLAGFADASAFTRAYRRHFDRLPSADRRLPAGAT